MTLPICVANSRCSRTISLANVGSQNDYYYVKSRGVPPFSPVPSYKLCGRSYERFRQQSPKFDLRNRRPENGRTRMPQVDTIDKTVQIRRDPSPQHLQSLARVRCETKVFAFDANGEPGRKDHAGR